MTLPEPQLIRLSEINNFSWLWMWTNLCPNQHYNWEENQLWGIVGVLNGKAAMAGGGDYRLKHSWKTSACLLLSSAPLSLNRLAFLLWKTQTPLPELWDGNATEFLAVTVRNNDISPSCFSCFTLGEVFTKFNEKFKFLKIFIRFLNNISKKKRPIF